MDIFLKKVRRMITFCGKICVQIFHLGRYHKEKVGVRFTFRNRNNRIMAPSAGIEQ